MCNVAQVLRYTVLSQNFHCWCFRAMTVKLSGFCLFNICVRGLEARRKRSRNTGSNVKRVSLSSVCVVKV